MKKYYLVDFIYEATELIKSLPEFHSIRWSAWVRYGCNKNCIDWKNYIESIVVFRNSERKILKGELIRLRLVLNNPDILLLSKLQNGMNNCIKYGEFNTNSFRFIAAYDAVSGQHIDCQKNLSEFSDDVIENEVETLMKAQSFHLVFVTPIRITLPSEIKTHKYSSESKIVHKNFFDEYPYSISYLAEKSRCSHSPYLDASKDLMVNILDRDLHWVDLKYNQFHSKIIGGVIGNIYCSKLKNRDIARNLICGQYVGSGKSGRLGFGFYVIPETESSRNIVLPYSI